jgi:hypothetical protein
MVRAEADREACSAEFAPTEVADIEFAARAHVGRRGIADMGIVGPDDAFALRAVKFSKWCCPVTAACP